MEYLEAYTYNGFKLYSSSSYFQCQFLYLSVAVKFKALSLLLITELNHCNIIWGSCRLVTVYNYQRLKRQYSILLNGIVPKNREQFLAFKETGSFRLFLCRVSASKRGVGGISESFGSNFFLSIPWTGQHGFNAADLFTVKNQLEFSLKTLRKEEGPS